MAESSAEQGPEDMEAWSSAAMKLLEDAKIVTSEWHETSMDYDFTRPANSGLGYTPHVDRGPKAERVFDAKLGSSKKGLEIAEAALQRCSAVLLQLQHERQSKWAAFKVCKWRLDLRARRPPEECFRDHLQEALEHEMEVLTASRQTLADRVAEGKVAIEDCEANRVRLLRNVRLMVCSGEANPPPFSVEEVIAILRQVVERRDKSLGAYHPDTLRTMSELASQLAPTEEANLRTELQSLPLPTLRKRAMAAGATKFEVQELCKQKQKNESAETVEPSAEGDDLPEVLINFIFSKQAVEALKLRRVIAERREVLRLRREAAERSEAGQAPNTKEVAASDEVQPGTSSTRTSLQESGMSAEAIAELDQANDIPAGPPRPPVPSDAEGLLRRAPLLKDISMLLYRKGEALIEKEKHVCERASLKTTSAFHKRGAENNALRKDLENQMAEMDRAVAAAELSMSRMRKRIQHFQETDLQPKVDIVEKLVEKLRATREELEADLTRKVVSIRIDDSCRKITPERSMQDPMTMPVLALLVPKPKSPPKGRRRDRTMKRQNSSPAIVSHDIDSALTTASTFQPPLSPAGSSSALKVAGNFLAS